MILMGKLVAYGKVENDKLIINGRKTFDEDIKQFEGKQIILTVEKYVPKRSTAQNTLWWVYMGILSKELGFTKEEMHEICKYKFLKRQKVIELTGEIVEYLASTAKLNKIEFGEVIDSLMVWSATDLNIVLPEPNTQFKMME